MPRNPNTKCTICGKPLYRRPCEFKEGVEFCCKECKSELYKNRFKEKGLPIGLKIGHELTKQTRNNNRIGTKQSQKTKDKISIANKLFWENNPQKAKERGQKQSKNSTRKTELHILIRSTEKYKEWRKSVFKRDDYICQKCGVRSKKGVAVYLQAHHKKPLSLILHENNIKYNDFKTLQKLLNLDELWDINNGETLCLDCHKKIHKKNNIYVRRRYRKKC